MNNCADFERAQDEHWYRIPVQSAPEGVREIRWIAFCLTKAFGREKWSVDYWGMVQTMKQARRGDLLPADKHHPRAQNWYWRLDLEGSSAGPGRSTGGKTVRRKGRIGMTNQGMSRRGATCPAAPPSIRSC